MPCKEKLALITGATSGIGKSLCQLLASEGVDLLITGRQQGELQKLQKKLSSQVSVEAFSLDLVHLNDVKTLVKVIEERGPDLIVNNAGFGLYGSAVALSIEEQKEIVDLNIRALMELSLVGANRLKKNGEKGVIVNVSSVVGHFPFPYFAVYAASKAFVTSFSESLNAELSPYGIHVLAACPGRVATGFGKRASGGKAASKHSESKMSAEFAAEQIYRQIQTKKSVHTFNWQYRLVAFLSNYIVPRWFLFKLLKKNRSER